MVEINPRVYLQPNGEPVPLKLTADERLARIEESNARIEEILYTLLELAGPFLRGKARTAVIGMLAKRRL